jgi:hypothetical protein
MFEALSRQLPATTRPARTGPGKLGFTQHVIQNGDTLSGIALKLLEDARSWTEMRGRERAKPESAGRTGERRGLQRTPGAATSSE